VFLLLLASMLLLAWLKNWLYLPSYTLVGILTVDGVPDVSDVVTSVPTLFALQTVVGVPVVAVVAAVSASLQWLSSTLL
jgi:hypothetical protein